jgi:hypothetical protein
MSSGAMGSSVQFDVTPFYPFHEFFSKLSTRSTTMAGGNKIALQDSRPDSRNSTLLSSESIAAVPNAVLPCLGESSREEDEMEDGKALLLEPLMQS